MKIKKKQTLLSNDEKQLLEKYDKIAQKRHELSQQINDLSKQLGDKFSVVLKQRQSEYTPLSDDIIEQSSANDKLIDEYYELSNTMIEIENGLKLISNGN